MPEIQRRYLYDGARRIHYRHAGSGPPLVMLHASPGSSAGLEPRIRRFAGDHAVYALNTPGNGDSDPLDAAHPDIPDYAEALLGTLDALGLPVVDLYGSHTGAKIALAFANAYPGRIRRLILDGVGLYTPEEQEELIRVYTPEVTPRSDGSHIVQLWNMRRDMYIFWPWYKRTPEARIQRTLPGPNELHAAVVDVLRSPNYALSYQAAFRYDPRAALSAVSVPTLYVAAAVDPLAQYIGRSGDLSSTINVAEPAGGYDPLGMLTAQCLSFLAGDPLPDAPPPPAVIPAPGAVRRDYAPSRVRQLLMRRSGDWTGVGRPGSPRPIVMLHASPVSSRGLEGYLLALGQRRPVVTFDTPGQGDSAPSPGTPECADLAAIIVDALDSLGLAEIDLYGTHTGAMIAMEIALARPAQVHRLILDGITLWPKEKVDLYLANYLAPIVPTSDGGHLVQAWSMLRDMALWWPWFQKGPDNGRPGPVPDANALHRNFAEFIKGGLTFHLAYRAAFAYPTAERLPQITTPILHTASPTDPLQECIEPAMRLTRNGRAATHGGAATPERLAATAAFFEEFFNG